MKTELVNAYLNTAHIFANLSKANKLKVGALLVKDERIISIGYNGTPSGWSNVCEDENGKTVPEVIHAEQNCISKLAKSTESGDNSIMFITHSPCMQCAKSIYNAGIKEVYYNIDYRDDSGIIFLEKCGISVKKIES